MRHKRTVLQVEVLAPRLLREESSPADAAAGGSTVRPLAQQLSDIQSKLSQLQQDMKERCEPQATTVKELYQQSTEQSILYGIWPAEALAARRGVQLTTHTTTATTTNSGNDGNNDQKKPSVQDQLQQSLQMQSIHVDRLEKIPSPYYWFALESMERRLTELKDRIESLQQQLGQVQSMNDVGIVSIVQSHTTALAQVTQTVYHMHSQMEKLRAQYNAWETGDNLLDKRRAEERDQQQRMRTMVQSTFVKAAAPTTTATTQAPAPAGGGLFGAKPAPAPGGGGLFGGSTFGKTPAPSTSLFGSTTTTPAPSLFGAPAPAPGGLFGSTTNKAPAPGGLFGGAAAPTPAPLFGAAPPAPTFGAPAAATTPATPAFGSTPAPATTFGGAAPAPSLFGATPAPAFGSSTPKTKSKSRSGRRK